MTWPDAAGARKRAGISNCTTTKNIKEFHTGPTYASTEAKFGKSTADRQAVAAALHKAGKREDTAMADKGMKGELGMSPRKAMASGMTGSGNFGAEHFDSMQGGMGAHPDHTAHTGMKGHMPDAERATPPAIHHTKGHMPAQAAPRHGPHHPGGYGDHARGGKV